MRLLLVEDDAALSRRLSDSLKKAGFAVDVARDGVDAEYMGNEINYDMVVLDLGLPKKSGLDVLLNWRSNQRTMPVIILTARDAWHERVDGFKAGADDYVGKPFHFEELLLRIQALLRRNSTQQTETIKVGKFLLNEDKQCLESRTDNEIIELTGIEFRLLRYFIMHPDVILSKDRLTEHVYANDADKDSNVIEVYINHLRKKLGKDIVTTRRGQGYLYEGNLYEGKNEGKT